MKCLVADPSATLRRALRNALAGIRCDEIVEAADGQQALDRCDASVDVVITEWNLPVLSGVDLVRRLRSQPDTANVRVLMLTARNQRADVLEAREAGVNRYLLKPFTLEALRHHLEALLLPETIENGAGGEQEREAA